MRWHDKLARGELVIIDGGVGSELARRGVPMSNAAWSGTAVLAHASIVTAVHLDYVRAGADVIIVNTFGSARFMLEAAGVGDRFESVNRAAVQCARRARIASGNHDVAIAGSMSNLPPNFDVAGYPPPAREQRDYDELAALLAAADVDLIALEMVQEPKHGSRALAAAKATGLPVWLGISVDRNGRGDLVGFDRHRVPLGATLDALLRFAPDVVNIMHSPLQVIDDAIVAVRRVWNGPLGVYPEIPYSTAPVWQCAADGTPERLVAHARGWVAAGVSLVGGCCGTGPEHIRALSVAFASDTLVQ